MRDLIEALQIFAKYTEARCPTNCSHDELHVDVDPSIVTSEDMARLDELGFFPNEYDGFSSYRFGSC